MASSPNADALKSEIRAAVINRKANACPMVVRLAWHASGTYDQRDNSGGSNGATMRFDPEASDDANKGLHIVRDMLYLVKKNNPDVTYADLWTYAGCCAVEFMGGPSIPFSFGRTDAPNGSHCPSLGRLPDGNLGAQHLRDVFYRMGFNDREIVCLSGAHTLGRCHQVRSGFDGPWTRHPLRFDNTYFKNLLNLEWKPREWDGPLQYEDVLTGELMMLPTDMALTTDAEFRKYAQMYAQDEKLFFEDFAATFAKLLSLGTKCHPKKPELKPRLSEREYASHEFREAAMHGSLETVKRYAAQADVHGAEPTSGRTALHKAAFWGHIDTVRYLLEECGLSINAVDFNGDTALHDAVRFGHKGVVEYLLSRGTDITIKNRDGKDPLGLALQYEKREIMDMLQASSRL